jgi:hypothetical protein
MCVGGVDRRVRRGGRPQALDRFQVVGALAVLGLLDDSRGGAGARPGRQSTAPAVAGLFQEGRLSYSKVRKVTRVVNVVDEQRLAELALTGTASQLARMISGFRAADGQRMTQQTKRAVSWHRREDGMIEVRTRLPKDEAAVLLAAIDTAKDQFGPPHSNRTRPANSANHTRCWCVQQR